jgi:hypothetical protein
MATAMLCSVMLARWGSKALSRDSSYRSGRSPDWLKMKNPACAAVKHEAEEDWGQTRLGGADMVISHINDPEHWHHRAEEARALADQMNDEASKQTMLRIAAEYEHLAKRAAERAGGWKPSPRS